MRNRARQHRRSLPHHRHRQQRHQWRAERRLSGAGWEQPVLASKDNMWVPPFASMRMSAVELLGTARLCRYACPASPRWPALPSHITSPRRSQAGHHACMRFMISWSTATACIIVYTNYSHQQTRVTIMCIIYRYVNHACMAVACCTKYKASG